MTENETKKIIAYIITAYPNFKPDNMKYTVEFWMDMLDEYTYGQVYAGLKAYISTDKSGFAPSIGQIIDKIHNLTTQTPLNEMEAWSLVSKALKNGYYGAEEEFKKLPPVVQKAVGSPQMLRNWASTDIESIENVVQSNFMRTYKVECMRESERQRMPPDIRAVIDKANENRPKLYIEPEMPEIEKKDNHGVPMPESAKERLMEMFADLNKREGR
jgi:hypothetical protein